VYSQKIAMNIVRVWCSAFAVAAFAVVSVAAQQPGVPANPAPGCSLTPAQVEANRKVAISFFDRTVDPHTLIDPSYKQHNPGIKKQAEQAHITDAEQINQILTRLLGPDGRQPLQQGVGQGNGPQPPAGNVFEIVTATCDIVTIIHKQYRPDPTAAPGTFYESFAFDAFRVRNGKVVEHWDGALIQPPQPPVGAAGGQRGQ
jgi:predicted SnoaL-like aldol condensation-catalyzing enzyme